MKALSVSVLIANVLQNVLATQYAYDEMPASWIDVKTSTDMFAARNGHAIAVFNKRLWLTGGRSERYQQANLEYSYRRGDVWSSGVNAVAWTQSIDLTGDFSVQNFDALDPGTLAPWYARFGHSLTTINYETKAGKTAQGMILMGGFTPAPLNDVWFTADGKTWKYAGAAPWPGRAWHATAYVGTILYVIGGTPLSNDVWALRKLTELSSGSFVMDWIELTAAAPWSPRCGMEVTVLPRANNSTQMFLTGGYAGWPREDSRWDGERTRNDIWVSTDGATWTLVTASAPWSARAWHSVVTWSSLTDPTADVVKSSRSLSMMGGQARMWLAGGGYLGTNQNNVVSKVIAQMDMWFSSDGLKWYKANYEEGSGANAYSCMEWTATEVDNTAVHLGVWGHKMVAWEKSVSVTNATSTSTTTYPALYFVAGDTSGDGALSNLIYVSNDTLLCLMNGVVCGGKGKCLGTGGCSCSADYSGDFCETSLLGTVDGAHALHISVIGTITLLLASMFLTSCF